MVYLFCTLSRFFSFSGAMPVGSLQHKESCMHISTPTARGMHQKADV